MPKKGKKRFKNKKNAGDTTVRKVLEKEDDQDYARVIKVLGSGRYLCSMNVTGKEVLGKVRGLMRRRKRSNWVGLDSVVLISIRDFETSAEEKTEHVDIIHVYDDKEVRQLKKTGDFIEDVKRSGVLHKEDIPSEEEDDEDVGFDFNDI